MAYDIEGIFLRKDFSEYITESFAKKYNVNLTTWIQPFGFFDEFTGNILHNGNLPDGIYVILGKVSYPGEARLSKYCIGQFNLCKIFGDTVEILNKFNPYPNVPEAIKPNFKPKFPMFRLGDAKGFKILSKSFNYIASSNLTSDALMYKISKISNTESTIKKIYSLKLALLRDLEK